MDRKKLLAAALAFIIVMTLTLFIFVKSNSENSQENVIGPNPHNIPEKELPICNFTGAEFIEKPCYSPPGSSYL